MAYGEISIEDPRDRDVRDLLEHHLAFANSHSPPEDVHALDVDALRDPAVTLFAFRRKGELLGVGALKQLEPGHVELKSMHTAEAARGRGIGRAVLEHLIGVARGRGCRRVSLETGSMPAFAPARSLYARAGFRPCEPFGAYSPSRNSMFMTLSLLEQCGEGGIMRDVLEWAAHLPEVTFADGAEVLVEGRHRRELLILVEGAVGISKSGAQISVIEQPGAIFGEMAVLLDSPSTATVTALGECRFLRSDDPETLLRDRPGLALEIAMTLARRLDVITGYLADLRNQYADRGDHLGVVDEVLETLMQHQGHATEPGSDRESDAPY